MSGRTQKLNLYLDDVVLSGFEIKANANDATFTYTGKALKMDGDLQYKNGVAYTSVLTQFGTVIASVNTEYNRAVAAETVLNGLVVSEATTARAAESKLTTDLAAEVKRSTDIDVLFQAADATETAARISADSKLTTDLAFEVAARSASDTVITGLVSTETASRISNDADLTARIYNEELKRLADDATEYNRAVGAEFVLRTDLAFETTRALSAEAVLSSSISSTNSSEAKLRSDADIALGVRIDFITVNVDAKKMDSLAEIVNKVNTVGVDVYTRLARIEEVLVNEILRGSSIYSGAQASYVAGIPAEL
jgi:hypothetical protein